MTRKNRRLITIILALGVLGVATGLILNALGSATSFFVTPDELAVRDFPPGQALRLGGLVEAGSVERQDDDVTMRFAVVNADARVSVVYRGLLPDLFREGQGVVAEGKLEADGTFTATRVLAKHDENYMPPELAEKLKERGEFRPMESLRDS